MGVVWLIANSKVSSNSRYYNDQQYADTDQDDDFLLQEIEKQGGH